MKRFLIMSILAGTLSACGGGGGGSTSTVTSPTAPVLPTNTVVTVEAYGESTMVGYGLPAGQDIPTYLASMLCRCHNVNVINNGVPSTTAQQMFTGTDGKNLPWNQQMSSSNAKLIVLNRGINEPFNNISQAAFKATMTDVIRIARQFNKIVVLQTPNPTFTGGSLDAGVDLSAQTIRDLGRELNVPVDDANQRIKNMLTAGGTVANLYHDTIHPGNVIYIEMARGLATIIDPLL